MHIVVAVVVVIVGLALWAASPIATIVFVAWFVFAASGYIIGQPKGRGGIGILLGSLLGPIGLLIVALLAPRRGRDAVVSSAIGPPAV